MYDQTRQPVGVELHLGFFTNTGRPLQELTILDAGCGTGSYARALAPHVGRLVGLDLNSGMLAVAEKKLAPYPNTELHQGSITELPFPDEHADGVMLNQVIHHLPPDDGFAALRSVFAEAARVTRPGGVFVLHTSTKEQMAQSYWWAQLIPKAAERLAERLPARFAADGVLEAMGREVGLTCGGVVVPVSEVLQGEDYLDPSGPLSKNYRDGDSTWALATEEELQNGLSRLRGMIEDTSIDSFLARAERTRKTYGQCLFVWFRKGDRAVDIEH